MAEEIQWLQIFRILKAATTTFSICLSLELEYYLNLFHFIPCLQNRGHCKNDIYICSETRNIVGWLAGCFFLFCCLFCVCVCINRWLYLNSPFQKAIPLYIFTVHLHDVPRSTFFCLFQCILENILNMKVTGN